MYTRLLTILFLHFAVSTRPPNFVFILTDDQDVLLDGLVPMEKTKRLVANEGITFNNTFVHSPICCPSRSSLLTGKYLHSIGVQNNSISGNCSSHAWQALHEPRTFVSLLKERKKYTTFYAGKYLNEYGSEAAGGTSHVPVGYDWWFGLKGNSKYYNYTLSINGTAKFFANDYLTDVMKNYALDFLNQKHVQSSPFLLMLAPPAAHAPFTPAPRHSNAFPRVKAVRTPSFNHTPVNKHWLLQLPPLHLPENVTILDNIHRHRQQTLLAVDEMVESIVVKLKELSLLDNTVIIFTSDNGFHIGQFGQPWDKRQPYETDIRVPLFMSGPNVGKGVITPLPVSLVDLAPTILDIAGINVPEDMDGTSFKSYLGTAATNYERILLVEYFGEGGAKQISDQCPWKGDDNLTECYPDSWCKCQDARNNTYVCLRHISPTINFKQCHFEDDKEFIESYNLLEDPYEINNLHIEVRELNT